MSRAIASVILLGCLFAANTALAQTAQPSIQPVDTQGTPTDIGTLQAQLAEVEAERQRLADQLAAGTDNALLEQLQRENRELLTQQAEHDSSAQAQLEAQRQEWFLIGGGSVLLSLVAGFLLANMGGRRKRSEWLN